MARIIFVSLFCFLCLFIIATCQITCQCDGTTSFSNGNLCTSTTTSYISGCNCLYSNPVFTITLIGSTYTASCATTTATSQSTTTYFPSSSTVFSSIVTGVTTNVQTVQSSTVAGTTKLQTVSTNVIASTTVNTVNPDNDNDTKTVTNYTYVGPCDVTALNGDKRRNARIFFYVGSGWVIFWTLVTVIVNMACGEWGHHRFLGIFEEFCIIVLFAFLGFFVWGQFDFNTKLCKATAIVLHYFMILVLSYFLFEAFFAHSLIKGNSKKNGAIFPFLNYILPILIPIAPVVVAYLELKQYYGATGVHCFVIIYTNMFWAFVIPPWIVWSLALLVGQLAFLACQQHRNDVDQRQLYWAFKICKIYPLLSSWLLTAYFLAMFALDTQQFWIFALYLGFCVFLGPAIFVAHTFCYQKTATKIWRVTSIRFYRPCPQRKQLVNPYRPSPPHSHAEATVAPMLVAPPPGHQKEPPMDPYDDPVNAYPPPHPMAPTNEPVYTNEPTISDDFYDWVADRNPRNILQAKNVLFQRKTASAI